MERDRSFNFKLWVPPRVSNGQGYSKCSDKEQRIPSPNISMVAPTKPTRQDFPKMKVVPPMEQDENNCNPGQLYSKLLDEVEKIKCWKIKADADTAQKERRLQENKKTIETQRNAIHEIQFENESLSVKLEEQISENQDLRNKNNATRNLCNLLNDTFQRTAANIHLFESEREETHQLFMDNSENVQKLIAAFESLRIQAEADQQEMQKVKEALLQFEDLKEKCHQEYNLKEKEVSVLQTKLKDTEDELQKILLDFHEAQTQCKQLREATNEQQELLKSSKTEQESLLQQLLNAEQRYEAAEKKCEAIATKLEQNKEEYAETIQSRDLNLEELTRVKHQQAEKMEEIQTTNQELQKSLAVEIQRASELEDKLMSNNQELERTNTLLGETVEQSAKKDGQIKILEDELIKVHELQEQFKSKSVIAAELENEVQKLKLTAADAIKNKEDTELKCQRKIADMMALMEKYKSQYDRMAEEKDAEHDENKKKVMEAIACQKLLELDLLKQRVDNDQLKEQLKTEVTEKENLQKELTDLKKEMTSLKMTQLSAVKNKQSPALNSKQVRCSRTPKESSSKVFDFSKSRETLPCSQDGSAAFMKKSVKEFDSESKRGGISPKIKEIHIEDLKTAKNKKIRVEGASKIKSYRIKTPPPSSQTAHWEKSVIELDPKSDSSDQADLFVKFPVTHKSPGNSLKLAAIKRMRDAGWTAVIGCDKKKKKTIEKIFA